MTIRDLRDLLFNVANQDREISLEDINALIGLKNRYDGIEAKIDALENENSVSDEFIKGWIKEKKKAYDEIRNF